MNSLYCHLLSENTEYIIHRTVILPVFFVIKLALALKEELRLKVFEYRALRKAFCSRREDLAGNWRIPLNE